MTDIDWLDYNGVILFDSEILGGQPAYSITWRSFGDSSGWNGIGGNQDEAAKDLVDQLKEVLLAYIMVVEV